MRITKRLGFLLLSVYLILVGLSDIFNLSFTGKAIIVGLLALAAGILLLLER